MFCNNCGKEVPDDARFCPDCGAMQSFYGNQQMPFYSATIWLKDDWRLLSYILYSLVTFGIYHYYFIYKIAFDVNIACKGDGEETDGLVVFILLSLVTCGIYTWIWYYKLGNRLAANAGRYGLSFEDDGTTVLLWMTLGGILCGIGPFVAIHILIKNTNSICNIYNRTYNYVTSYNNPANQMYNQTTVAPVQISEGYSNVDAIIATMCGISSIVVAILGGILFGIFGGLVAVVLGIIAIGTGISARKATNNAMGLTGFICGILGLVFGIVFIAGCGIYGTVSNGYGCYGSVGGSYKARYDLSNALDDFYDWEELYDYYY